MICQASAGEMLFEVTEWPASDEGRPPLLRELWDAMPEDQGTFASRGIVFALDEISELVTCCACILRESVCAYVYAQQPGITTLLWESTFIELWSGSDAAIEARVKNLTGLGAVPVTAATLRP